MPNQKMEAALSVQQKTKWRTDQVITKLLIFEEKGWVISDKNYAGRSKQYCLNTKKEITLKFND